MSEEPTRLLVDRIDSPIGRLLLVTGPGDALCALDFEEREADMAYRLARRFGAVELRAAEDPGGHSTRLRAYLDGDLSALDDARVDAGGTSFQREVWSALRRVPVGATRSYSEIAREIGKPGAARAVGTANGRNPIALVIPCHRVIAADESLGGYAGGLERKSWLLQHEGARYSSRGTTL